MSSYTLIIHVSNEEAVVVEIDELPQMNATLIMVKNPRKMDGKDLHYLNENVVTVMWPVSRINFIEVLSTKEDEEIIGFVRE
jgi:hypothetical protein